MRQLTKIAILTSAMVCGGAFAQTSANIISSGTITPVACTIAITTAGGSTWDWGTQTQTDWLAQLDAASLSSGPDYKLVGNLNHALTVTCPSATKVALGFQDNHATATPPAGAVTYGTGAVWYPTPFGVADVNNGGVHEGMFAMFNSGITVNGGTVPGTKFRSPIAASPPAWDVLANGSQGTTHNTTITPGYTYAFTPAAGATAPVGITSMEGVIGSETYLNRPYVSALTTVSKFESNVTVALKYF